MQIQQSSEDYLETILILSKKLPVVRAVDIAIETGHKNSSISVAMKKLRSLDLITVTDAGFIYLTEEEYFAYLLNYLPENIYFLK